MNIPNKATASQFEATSSTILSEIDVKGKFDFHTFCILLNSLQKSNVDNVNAILKAKALNPSPFSQPEYAALSQTLPLAFHEFTHFIDSTATVWGANLLTQTSSAYSSATPDETQFIRAKRHYDYLRSIRLPSYYTLITRIPEQDRPWRCIPSIGKLFDKHGGVSDRPVCKLPSN